MKRHLGTRIEEDDKQEFKAIAQKYKLSESALIRLMIIAIIQDDEKLIPIIMDTVKRQKSSTT
ncbi:MAG TPA: type II toxin-antitoxin system RelB/DinJ family antitoxin [Candidatus Dojkabacteria bacterium]|jgi:antitoxin component of RelBE/YafQ-DinJ toxin-antitoxin module